MSTIYATRTRLRMTRRGRRVLLGLFALPLAAAVSFATFSDMTAAASSEAGQIVEFATTTVLPGDTLWSIAALIAPEADPRDVVDSIMRLNQLNGAAISVGQQLAIPAEYIAVD